MSNARGWYQRRLAAGLCVDCSEPALPQQARCENHRDRERARARATAERIRQQCAHPCPRCGRVAYKAKLCQPCAVVIKVSPRGHRFGMRTPFDPNDVIDFLKGDE